MKVYPGNVILFKKKAYIANKSFDSIKMNSKFVQISTTNIYIKAYDDIEGAYVNWLTTQGAIRPLKTIAI